MNARSESCLLQAARRWRWWRWCWRCGCRCGSWERGSSGGWVESWGGERRSGNGDLETTWKEGMQSIRTEISIDWFRMLCILWIIYTKLLSDMDEIYFYISLHTHSRQLSLPISAESRLRRPVGAGNANTPAGFADDAYTPANENADGTTWRRPYEAWQPSVTSWPQYSVYIL